MKFYGVTFEPHQAKIAVHTQSRKELAPGQVSYSNDNTKNLVDIYQIKSDTQLGFQVKTVGCMPSDKIVEVYFSGTGNILCTIDLEGMNRYNLNFFLITKQSNEGQFVEIKRLDQKKNKKVLQ